MGKGVSKQLSGASKWMNEWPSAVLLSVFLVILDHSAAAHHIIFDHFNVGFSFTFHVLQISLITRSHERGWELTGERCF